MVERTVADPVQPVRQRLPHVPGSILEAGAGLAGARDGGRAQRDLLPRPRDQRVRDITAACTVERGRQRPGVLGSLRTPTAMCGLAVKAASPIRHARPEVVRSTARSKMTWMKGWGVAVRISASTGGRLVLAPWASSLEQSWRTRPRGTEVVNRVSSSPVRRSSSSAPGRTFRYHNQFRSRRGLSIPGMG